MKTVTEIRAAFWESHPQYKRQCKATQAGRIRIKTEKRQNDYKADIRMAFVDFVDMLSKDGTISEKLAFNATL